VIGELGQHGLDVTGNDKDRVLQMRLIQRNVATIMNSINNENNNEDTTTNTTIFVPTAHYAGKPTSYDLIHHYYGRADTIYNIGKALGNAMIDVLKQQQQLSNDPTTTHTPSESQSTIESTIVPTSTISFPSSSTTAIRRVLSSGVLVYY
jgi:hypothetical protein